MTDAEIIIFPGVRIEEAVKAKRPRKKKSGGVTIEIVLNKQDCERLEQVAEQRGISPQDAAGRLLRSTLRTWRPWGGGDNGGDAA